MGPHATNNQTKLTALAQGLKITASHNLTSLKIAIDSIEAINTLHKGNITSPLFMNADI